MNFEPQLPHLMGSDIQYGWIKRPMLRTYWTRLKFFVLTSTPLISLRPKRRQAIGGVLAGENVKSNFRQYSVLNYLSAL
jgi:hypothetical protein